MKINLATFISLAMAILAIAGIVYQSGVIAEQVKQNVMDVQTNRQAIREIIVTLSRLDTSTTELKTTIVSLQKAIDKLEDRLDR